MSVVSVNSRAGILLTDGRSFLANAPKGQGVANLLVGTDGVSLSVNENADPTVREDHMAAISRFNAGSTGAAQALLFKKSITLPYRDGRFCFGTWQGIYLIDLRGREAGSVDVVVSYRPSEQRSEFTVEAAARSATPLQAHIQGESKSGCAVIHEKHTSASLCVGEQNLEPTMRQIVPEKWNDEFFVHTYEGPDDMPGHMKCSLLGCSATVPLGQTGQPLVPVQINEHRDAGGWSVGHSRTIIVDILKSGTSAEVQVEGMTDVTKLVASYGDLVNIVVKQGPGGFLVGSAEAVGAYKPPSDAILPRSIDWPAAAMTSLWWMGSSATILVTPL